MQYITWFVLLFIHFAAFSQESRKNYFPIWTYHQDHINVHGISVGIGPYVHEPRLTNTNGIKIELIGVGILFGLLPQSPIAENDSDFQKMASDTIWERINGLSLSGSGTFCHCVTNGMSAGLIGQINYAVNGLALVVFLNMTQKQNGVMLAFSNDAYYMNGLQMGMANAGKKVKGLQVAAYRNDAVQISGVQLGLINKAKKLRGIQVGLWNINNRRKLPVVNWNFRREN